MHRPAFKGYDEHRISMKELFIRFETSPKYGLSNELAQLRLMKDGPNILKSKRRESSIIRFIKIVFHGFSLILWVATFLSLLVFVIDMVNHTENYDHLVLAMSIIVVIFVSAAFEYFQEGQSYKVLESFMTMVPEEAEVLREGKTKKLHAKNIVVGDIVFLKSGDKVPADIRVIESSDLKVDNAVLTGESIPLSRSPSQTSDTSTHSENLLFCGTYVVQGNARGVVIRTGKNTMMGHIAIETNTIKRAKSTMMLEVECLTKLIVTWALFLGMAVLITMLLMGHSWREVLPIFVGIVVACVPEGLVATLTLCLTLATREMSRMHCLVKKIAAVETLGAVSIICTDKTGTLTQNKMTVCHLWFDNKIVNVYLRGIGLSKHERQKNCFRALAECGVLCSRAAFKDNEEGKGYKEIIGDPSESAILKCLDYILFGKTEELKQMNKKVFEIPFNSESKYQVSVHLTPEDSYKIVLKGAPEKVLEKCSTVLLEGGEAILTVAAINGIVEAYSELALMGERVLAFCDFKMFDFNSHDFQVPDSGFRFVGLFSLIDPPRPDVPSAVMQCRKGGVKVIMLTGDHHLTAYNIAKQVNIITENIIVPRHFSHDLIPEMGKSIVLEGRHLITLAKDELDKIILNYEEIVFARITPTQKLDIVESCQRTGAIVAVTGDGVNDAPAIKKADVGISMGITGTAVAKESADIVILDDNFASIVRGIEQGRLVFDNVKKSIAYTLTHTLPEIVPLVAHIIIGIPKPMGVLQLLIIDLVTDLLPAIAFAYEDPESDLMLRKPREVYLNHFISLQLIVMVLQIGAIETAAGLFSYFVVMAESGWWPGILIGLGTTWNNSDSVRDSFGREWPMHDRKILEYTCYNAFFVAIVITQLANVYNCKYSRTSLCAETPTNWYLNCAVFISIGLAFFISYVPFLATVFRMRPLRFQWYLTPIPFVIIIFAYDELRKLSVRRNPKKFFAKYTVY